MNKIKPKILISGPLNYGPIGRHAISFAETLIKNENNQIFIDQYWFDNFYYNEIEKNNLKLFFQTNSIDLTENHSNTEYDFLIYTGVLSHGTSDIQINRIINLKAKIKICYPVFDGTVPPLEWIDIINSHFDICTSPSNYVAQNLLKHGVKIPCFGLHCAILNKELLEKWPNHDIKKIRFGFIGAAEQRKNPIKVVEAFHKNFANNEKVELYLHCSYSFEKEYLEQLKNIIENYKKTSNIIFTYGENKDHRQMVEIFSSFNCYVYPQKTSGYFTTPAEALSLGIPIIISDIGVHQELIQDTKLSEEDGAFLINSNIAEPICHQSLDQRYLGAQYDCEVKDVSEAMLKFYNHSSILFDNESINKRKKAGSKYNANNLSALYNNIIKPKKIRIVSSVSYLSGDILFINSEELLKKYQNLYHNLNLDRTKETTDIQKFDFEVRDLRVTNLIENFSIVTQKQYIKAHLNKQKHIQACHQIDQLSSQNQQLIKILRKYKNSLSFKLEGLLKRKSYLKKKKLMDCF